MYEHFLTIYLVDSHLFIRLIQMSDLLVISNIGHFMYLVFSVQSGKQFGNNKQENKFYSLSFIVLPTLTA